MDDLVGTFASKSKKSTAYTPLTRFAPTLPIVSLLGVLAESSVFINYGA
jgi:hypothetical protein